MGKYAILVVSALIFSMITYSHALRNALFISNARTVESYSQNQAHNIAQSAAMVVINNLRNDSDSSFKPGVGNVYSFPSPDGFEPWPEMDGEYHIGVTNQADTMLVLSSTGRFEDTMYRTNIGLRIGSTIWNPTFDQALHSELDILGQGNISIECVHDTPQCHATLNSSEDNSVTLDGNVILDGDLFIGPGGIAESVISGLDKITGEVHTMQQKLDYPLPQFPNYEQETFMPGNSIYSQSTTLNPDDYDQRHIPELFMTSGNNTLTINTGNEDRTLRVGRMNLSGQNKIEVVGEGKLDIYVDYEIDMKGGSSINENGETSNLNLFYRGTQDVELYDETIELAGNTLFNGNFFADKANIKMRGTTGIQGNVITGGNVDISGDAEALSRLIYAPEGMVTMGGGSVIKGSVISEKFESHGNAKLIFDQDLDAELPDLIVSDGDFPIVYWN